MSGGWFWTCVGVALLAVPALLLPALLRVRGAAASFLAGLITASAVLVAGATAVSIFDAFTLKGMLAAQFAAALVSAGLWWKLGKPPLPYRRPRIGRAETIAAIRAYPAVSVLAALIGVALIVQLWQGVAVVSNDWDPVAYHLSRAAFWIQEQSVSHFTGGTPRELGYPPNAEILVAWTMLISAADHLTALVQWIALIGTGVAIYLGALELRFTRAGALLAALLFVSLPVPIMEATTAQNDDVAALFITAAALFGVRGLRDRHWGEITVGAAAVGLALGTKGIVLVAGPSLLLLYIAAARAGRLAPRSIAAALGIALAGFLLLGSFNFILNLKDTHDLYGNANESIGRSSGYFTNAAKVNWGYMDLPGVTLPWADPAIQQTLPDWLLRKQQGGFEFKLDSSPNDSQSAFGPIAFFLFVLAIVALFRRRSPPDRRILAGAFALFVLIFPLSAEWSPDLLRLATIGVALGAPLLAALERFPAASGAAVTLAALVLIPCVLWNPLRPVIVPPGAEPAYKQRRNAQYSYGRGEMAKALDNMDGAVSPTARIGFVGPGDGWDYPFFGPHLKRHVTRFLDTKDVTLPYMRDHQLDAVVVERLVAPRNLRRIRLSDSFVLVLPEAAG